MNPVVIGNIPAKELLDAQTHLWNQIFSFHNSMALKCAIDLGIPDAIHKHGKPMTTGELANSLSVQTNKAPSVYRLMRLLVHNNIFSKQTLSSGEEAFDLTINSQFLLNDQPFTVAPLALMLLDPVLIEPSFHVSSWFHSEDETPFHISQGMSMWEYAACVPKFNKLLNEGMASDSRIISRLLLNNNEFKGLLQGLESLVDVGGGNGAMAKPIAEAFPELTCIIYDQPHVVEGLTGCEGNIKCVGGDMFEAIPPAQAVLLKWILHDWSDDHCLKILRRCKEAIPSKEQGGKVIIIDMVVETNNNDNANHSHAQLFFDMEMMHYDVGGKERTEEEWKKLFNNAGFNDYKILPILAPRSIIEVYPS